MGLKLYEREATGGRSEIPLMTIGATGNICLNKALVILTGSYKWAWLYFDAERNQVAVKFAIEPDANTVRVLQNKNRGGFCVNGKGFFRHFGISIEKSKCYKATYLPDKRIAYCTIERADKK